MENEFLSLSVQLRFRRKVMKTLQLLTMHFNVEGPIGRRRDSVVGHAHVEAHVLAMDLRDVQHGTQDVAGCSLNNGKISMKKLPRKAP